MYYACEKQMEKLDMLAVKNGLQIRQMMELAGFHMLGVFKELNIDKKKKVVVVTGKGNKGGDGLCAARHLTNYGYRVNVILVSTKISPEALHHLKTLKKMKLSITLYPRNKKKSAKIINSADILIDALIGYHLKGAPRGDFAQLIVLMNAAGKKTIAYDLPSGLAVSGKIYQPSICAYATLSLALPKKAFKAKSARRISGKIFLGDIGIPKFLYDKIKKGSRPNFKGNFINL